MYLGFIRQKQAKYVLPMAAGLVGCAFYLILVCTCLWPQTDELYLFLATALFACAWMDLIAQNASPWLLASFCDFEPPEHVPRTAVRAHTCTAVFTRGSCVPATESTRNDPRAEEQKMPMCNQTPFGTY